jgi:hypothetical protein
MISSALKQNVWPILKVILGVVLTLALALVAIVAIQLGIYYVLAVLPPSIGIGSLLGGLEGVLVVVFLGIAIWSKHKLKALGKS